MHKAWAKQVKRVLHWLLKIFFAASIGFEVPVRDFGDLAVIGHACILFIAVLGKLATGLWVVPLRKNEVITVGLAMSAWGEFAFITATTARREGLMDAHTFSAVILAVMMSVVLSPTLLRRHLSRSSKTASCAPLPPPARPPHALRTPPARASHTLCTPSEPRTPNPALRTPHSAPCTPHSAPCTPHPAPCAP